MSNSIISTSILAVIVTVACLETQAAALNNGNELSITTGTYTYDANGDPTNITSGSYYGVDTNGDYNIQGVEKIQLAQGTTGLIIGVTSTPGAYHFGVIQPGDTNAVTAPDQFFGSTGSWYFDIAPTGSTESGLNMAGWDWAWNTSYSTGLGGLAWQPANCAALGCSGYTFQNGVGRLQWDGVYGHAYTLDATSTVPDGDPSGFNGSRFYTHLEGIVGPIPVPEPAQIWLFATALPILFGLARKREALGTTTFS